MTLWIALVGAAGALAQLAALIWAWVKLRSLWAQRWPNDPLSPIWAKLRARLTRGVRYEVRVHDVAGGVSSVSTVSGSLAPLSAEERFQQIEAELRQLHKTVADNAAATDSAIADLTGQHRLAVIKNDEDARDTTRSALTGPAILAIVGAALQLVASVMAIVDAVSCG